jgi:hypothetical protein
MRPTADATLSRLKLPLMPDQLKRMTPHARCELEALNWHGVFLKKRVLEEVRTTPGMGIFAEEFGVAFNEPVAIDIVGVDHREDRQLLFVFECKRAYTKEKTWVFFKDIDPTFRLCRAVSGIMQLGHYTTGTAVAEKPAVCSEGYELVASEKAFKADQRPVYEAGNQLCKGFLGFLRTRMSQRHRPTSVPDKMLDCILPVLVTTAELRVAEFDVSQISLQTGNLDGDLALTTRDWLILKHPFAAIENASFSDFRKDPPHQQDVQHWSQMYRESLFVVNSAKLPVFLTKEFRDYLDKLKIR